MARKPVNPYSKYGRKKAREEYYRQRASMTPEQRSETDTWAFVILLVIVIIVFLIGGMEGLADWAH